LSPALILITAPQSDAGDPDRRGRARRLDARFLGRSESVQRALPGTALSIVMRGADKEDLVIA
jgi:hypothetical protein